VVEHEIVPNRDGYSVCIYDAPAGCWHILFGQEEGAIGAYTMYEDAMAGVRIYDRSDKTVLFEAELEVYLRSARTGIALNGYGLPSLVRFGGAACSSPIAACKPKRSSIAARTALSKWSAIFSNG
jgi:hypothetical protein